MYDSLRPPTDNLYKFAAIFGLVLIALSVYIFDSFTFGTDANFAEFERGIADLERGNDDLERAGEIAEKAVELAEKLDSELTMMLWVCGSFLLAGAAISILGFALWYTRVQRHLDRILKCQMAEAEKKQRSAGSKV